MDVMLILHAYSRPGRLPDRQLVLGGTFCSFSPVQPFRLSWMRIGGLQVYGSLEIAANVIKQLYCLEHGIQVRRNLVLMIF